VRLGSAVGPRHEHVVLFFPRYFCGVGAINPICAFTIAVMVNGVFAVVALSVSCSPAGFDWNVRFTVFGWMFTLVVADRPPESVALSWISRYDG